MQPSNEEQLPTIGHIHLQPSNSTAYLRQQQKLQQEKTICLKSQLVRTEKHYVSEEYGNISQSKRCEKHKTSIYIIFTVVLGLVAVDVT